MTTKLLAVDDSKTMRRVLDITLNGDAFQTTICGSAAEALQAIRADRPAVALVDAALGGESGYDLCRQIKSEAPDVRVLILSSKHRPYDETQGSSVGADGNFDKPFDSQKLIDKVLGLTGDAPAAAAAPAARAPVAPAPVAARPAQPSAAPRPVAPAPTPAAPPVSTAPRPAASPAPASRAPIPAARPPITPGVPSVAARPPAAAPAANGGGNGHIGVAATAGLSDKLKELGLSAAQLEGVLALSREVVEQVVWEVVPVLAESMIKEEIARLTAE